MPFLAQKTYPIPEQDLLSWTFDNLTYDQDEPIYIDGLNPSNSISARQARKLIRQLVAGFHAIGLKRGDCVCIHSFNDICYPIFFLGIIAAGGVFAGTNPAYTPYELAHTLKTAKAKYVLVQPDLLDPVLAGIKDTAITEDKVIIFNPNQEATPSGFLQWSDLLKHGEQDWVTLSGQASKDTTAALLFSSGTTGLPKAAMLSHYNFIAQHTLVFEATTRPWRARRLLPLPMFHAATAPVAHTSPLRAGEPAYVLPRFEPETWWQALEKYEITDLLVVPPLVVLAVNSPLRHKYSLKAVRAGYVGAAPLDKALQARMQALLSEGVTLTQVWGMTETSCICTMFAYPDADVTGSVGYPLPGVDAKLVDDDGKDISGYDVRGELCVRGPNVIRGYFENPEANARDFDSDGFFHTGDIAFCDGKTKLWYIVDRKKVSWSSCSRQRPLCIVYADDSVGADQSPRVPSGASRARGCAPRSPGHRGLRSHRRRRCSQRRV